MKNETKQSGRKKGYQKKLRSIKSSLAKRGRKPVAIMELFAKFIKPISEHVWVQEDASRISAAMDLFFGVANRHLEFFRVTEDFEMPGELYVAGAVTQAGTGKRTIKENDLLLIVLDDRLEYVKVEVCRRKSEHNYKLTIPEWKFITSKIRRA